MSIDSIIPEVWSALVKENLERMVVWGSVVEDMSAEITMGDTVHLSHIITNFDNSIPQDQGTAAQGISDYSRNAEIKYGLTDADDIQLKLNKQKLWRFRIDDLDNLQTRPDLMERNTGRAMRALARLVNDDVRAAFAGDGSTLVTTAAGDTYEAIAAPPLLGTRYADKSDFVAQDSAYYNFAKDVLGFLVDAKEHADNNYWPEENRYVMMSPQAKNKLIEYLINEKPNLGSGMVIDPAFINGKLPGMVLGFEGYTDAGITRFIPSGAGASAANAKVQDMYFGLKNDGLAFAATVQKVEALRLQDYMADALRGLYVYGAGRIMPDRMAHAQFTVRA